MIEYTLTRFMSNLSPKMAKLIIAACKSGEQLTTDAIPEEALANVTILASFGKRIDVDIVDDYEGLVQRLTDHYADGGNAGNHLDGFLASSICILATRGDMPTIGGFEQVGIPDIFAQLFGDQDE